MSEATLNPTPVTLARDPEETEEMTLGGVDGMEGPDANQRQAKIRVQEGKEARAP